MKVCMRFAMTALCLAFSGAGAPASAQSGVREWGDTAGTGSISAATRRIQEEAGDWRLLLTARNLTEVPAAVGTEVRLATMSGQNARIVAQAWTPDGRYSIEYYLMGGALLLAFETFEYFEESAPPDSWHNSAGIPAWERRTWFLGGAPVAARTIGATGPEPGADAEWLAAMAGRLSALFERAGGAAAPAPGQPTH